MSKYLRFIDKTMKLRKIKGSRFLLHMPYLALLIPEILPIFRQNILTFSTLVMINSLPPPIGSAKLNFDKCSLSNLGRIGIGGVIRNHSHKVSRAYSKNAEARLAIKEGIST